MKLYTEEQVRKAIDWGHIGRPSCSIEEYMNSLTPIELMSDEEISAMARELFGKNKEILQYRAFKLGAKLMRYKIQGGNNV